MDKFFSSAYYDSMLARHYPLIVSGLVLLLFTLVVPFSSQHQLFNLEPYPDGLFYAGTAQNFSRGTGLLLEYREAILQPKIPPLYSLYLGLFYFLMPNPVTFYSANLVLAITALCFFYLAVRNITQLKFLQLWLLLLYVFHAYIEWFVTLPMAENLGMSLTAIILWLLTLKKLTVKHYLLVPVAAGLLVMTKYAYFPFAALGVAIPALRLFAKKDYFTLGKMAGVGVLLLFAYFIFLVSISFNPLSAFTPNPDSTAAIDSPTFFNFSLPDILLTTSSYLKMLAATKSTVLWLNYPLSTVGLSFMAVLFLVGITKVKVEGVRLATMTALAVSPLLLLQFFYVVDGRYILTAIPCLIIGLGYMVHALIKSDKLRTVILCMVLILAIQVISQISFYKDILAANLLKRSTAWQYEAILTIHNSLHDIPDPVLITALPPYLLQFYLPSDTQLVAMPLSTNQEFLNKNQFVWGDDIEYANLVSYYTRLLREGRNLYVTNAYISHSGEVADDYQQFTEQFALTPMSEGCLGTCNLFKLEVLPDNE